MNQTNSNSKRYFSSKNSQEDTIETYELSNQNKHKKGIKEKSKNLLKVNQKTKAKECKK